MEILVSQVAILITFYALVLEEQVSEFWGVEKWLLGM